jgi:4'-phosphopantetheinyl transferase
LPAIVVLRWMTLEPEFDAAGLWPLLDADEQARAGRFRFKVDRDSFVAAHALLRVMLSREAGTAPQAWRFMVTRHGKPEIHPSHGQPDLRFNLSHARGMAACAVARGYDVGVDVEACETSPAQLEMARQIFAPDELAQMEEMPQSEKYTAFYRLWTLKEAYTKAIGLGINAPLNAFFFRLEPVSIHFSALHAGDPGLWHFAEVVPGPLHRLALAVRHMGAGLAALDAGAERAEMLTRHARALPQR